MHVCEKEHLKRKDFWNTEQTVLRNSLIFVEKELNRCRENVAEEKKRIGEIEEKLSQVVIQV